MAERALGDFADCIQSSGRHQIQMWCLCRSVAEQNGGMISIWHVEGILYSDESCANISFLIT